MNIKNDDEDEILTIYFCRKSLEKWKKLFQDE